jgi:hypothetical protein
LTTVATHNWNLTTFDHYEANKGKTHTKLKDKEANQEGRAKQNQIKYLLV